MSGPNEPYASPVGILVGIGILWIGTFLIMLAIKVLFFSPAPSEEGEADDEEVRATLDEPADLESLHGSDLQVYRQAVGLV